eukprot:PhM_4_TR1892/c0_g1_i1/m.38033
MVYNPLGVSRRSAGRINRRMSETFRRPWHCSAAARSKVGRTCGRTPDIRSATRDAKTGNGVQIQSNLATLRAQVADVRGGEQMSAMKGQGHMAARTSRPGMARTPGAGTHNYGDPRRTPSTSGPMSRSYYSRNAEMKVDEFRK